MNQQKPAFNITLKSIILAAISVFIIISLLLLPFISYSKADTSLTMGETIDKGGDGSYITFAIFAVLCAIGLIASAFFADKKTTIGIAAAGFVMLLVTIFASPDMGEYAGFGAGIWVALIMYIAAIAVAILEIPALNKSLQ